MESENKVKMPRPIKWESGFIAEKSGTIYGSSSRHMRSLVLVPVHPGQHHNTPQTMKLNHSFE
jgi:hypothetical protein